MSGTIDLMNNFSLLWGKILESSLWIQESKETRLVWITMLAMKDFEGKVYGSMVGLADRAKVSPDECKKALKVLLSPDPDDTSKVEQGRRIREIQGGWQVINHDLYRFSTEAKREFWRQSKAEQRLKEKEKPKKIRKVPASQDKPSSAAFKSQEQAFVKAYENGDTKKQDEILGRGL